MAQRYLSVGDHVIAVDSKGRDHHAIITCIHGGEVVEESAVLRDNSYPEYATVKFDEGDAPCINLVYVDPDVNKQDSWGRQLHRESSFVHKSWQQTGGMYWRFLDEERLPMAKAHS